LTNCCRWSIGLLLTALREQVATGIQRAAVGRALVGLLIIAVLAVYLNLAPPGAWVVPP